MTKSGFDIDELERLLAAVTPGEWRPCELDQGVQIWCGRNYIGETRDYTGDDAALIVAARDSLPAMIAEIRELRAENARLREGASWPSYDVDVPDAWESYLLELCGFEHRRGWAHLPATFRWHDFWERLGKTITARAALGEPQ